MWFGRARFGINENWRKARLEHIKTKKDRLVARVIGNTVGRSVSSKEKRELLGRLGEIYLDNGREPRKIIYRMAEETGMSYQWIIRYLPDRFKDSQQSDRAKPALQCRAGISNPLDRPGDLLTIRAYRNTDFVNIAFEKTFYEQRKNKAKNWRQRRPISYTA